jgi:hypothetical protein
VAWKIGNKKMNDNFYSLYKYRPLFTLDLEGQRHPHPFTANIFKDAQIYYAAPKSFNDPFDCNLKLHFDDATQEEWRIYFDSLAKTYPRIQSHLQKAKRDIFRSKNGPEWRKFSNHLKVRIEKSRKWHYEDSSVFCLSKKPNSTQMALGPFHVAFHLVIQQILKIGMLEKSPYPKSPIRKNFQN